MRQKLAIVRTLLHRPKVIFLDEPTSGLDPESARTVRDAVAELAAEGRTIVLCSHNLPEVERLCTQVAVVKGKLLALAKVSELRREGLVLDVKVKGDAGPFVPVLARLPFAPSAFGEGPLLRVPLAQEDEAPGGDPRARRGGRRDLLRLARRPAAGRGLPRADPRRAR